MCYQGPGDGEGWYVVAERVNEPNVSKWPKVVRVIYQDEAERVCRAHNFDDIPLPEEPK